MSVFDYEVISHWYYLFEGIKESPTKFYEELRLAIRKRKIDDVYITLTDMYEGGVLTSKRKYLVVEWSGLQFLICAAPYGKGFFISWWLREIPSLLKTLISMIPFLGNWLIRLFSPMTYYKMDVILMYQESIHNAVLEVLDTLNSESGIRLSELERKPVLKSFIKKR